MSGPSGSNITDPSPRQWNYRRRAIGVAICFAPVLLLMVSAGAALAYPRQSPLAIALLVIAFLIALFNAFLGHLRPALYRWRHGSMVGYRNVSGVPLFGNLFVVGGGIVGFGDWRVVILGGIALVVDQGGLPWFLSAIWRDSSFWAV